MPGFTDQEWDEILQEIPKPDDPFIQKYLDGREALIAEEEKKRSDYHFRQSLSPIAKKACEIVARIRDEERREVWVPAAAAQEADTSASASTTIPSSTVHPGMMFPLAKEAMETTRLWKIVQRMPKGALLHAHCDAMVDVGFLAGVLLATPGMHIRCDDSPLATPEARRESIPLFRFRRERAGEEVAAAGSIWSPDYVPGTHVPLAPAADAFPGGRAEFVRWLESRCTISQADAVEQHHGLSHVWKAFQKCFMVIGTLLQYEPVFRLFLRKLMTTVHSDGISWAELRYTWPREYFRQGCDTPDPDYNHLCQVIEEEVASFKASPEGRGFWGLRIIWTSIRRGDTRTLIQEMDNCIATKLAWPDLIAGYDLVGQEDLGRPLADLLPELFWFRKQCASEGVQLPFFFHAGECLGTGDATDHNLFDALLLGTRRVGHGFSLYKHPDLTAAMRDRRILVESCPISNEVLRLCASTAAHPLPALLARGVPCSLSNDDPAILGHGTTGSSHDFWQALQGWHSLGLAGLGSLAENSVRWAAFQDQSPEEWTRDIREASLGTGLKAQRLKEWAVAWEEFCLWIVTEYGEEDEG